MKIIKIMLVILGSYVLVGCSSQPSIPKISEEEVLKYEKPYMDEYLKLKNILLKEDVKWIQATNKKEGCKLFVGYNPNDDRTKKIDYKIYWDGECRNGYAYGLGREFEKGLLTNIEAIAVYNEEGKKPEYYYQNYKLNNMTAEGDINNGYIVQTIITDDGMNFDIKFRNMYQDEKNKIVYFIENSPLNDNIGFLKGYPNFTYMIADFTNNEFDNRKYQFGIKDSKSSKFVGFGVVLYKNGELAGGEMQNGILVRKVDLPQSYIQKINSIFSEIKDEMKNIKTAQQKASMVKVQYKNKICQENIKVDFMDNDEYKAICKEEKIFTKIKIKIDEKLVQIEQQKHIKRQQQNEQKLIQARDAESMAAQRRASAAEEANNQAGWQNLNQSIQNMNYNNQMQQLNNNLFMMR